MTWELIFTSEAFWSLVALGLTALFGFLFKLLKKVLDRQGEQEAVDVLRDAVAATQDEFVIFAKRAAADGKLSDKERQEAKELAIKKAKSMATGPALKVIQAWGEERLSGLIQRIVTGNKKNDV